MKHKKLFRHYHSFYAQKNNSLYETNQEQSSEDVQMRLSPLDKAPDIKIKIGLERFLDRYPNYQEMFIGSRK